MSCEFDGLSGGYPALGILLCLQLVAGCRVRCCPWSLLLFERPGAGLTLKIFMLTVTVRVRCRCFLSGRSCVLALSPLACPMCVLITRHLFSVIPNVVVPLCGSFIIISATWCQRKCVYNPYGDQCCSTMFPRCASKKKGCLTTI